VPATNYTDELRHLRGGPDEFTGDPRVRDLWEETRRSRHALIRIMHGDPWAEMTTLQKVAAIVASGFWFIVAVPFLWVALSWLGWMAYGIICMLLNVPSEEMLGRLGSFNGGGLGNKILLGAFIASVLLSCFGVWGRLGGNEREIRRLRGLSNTDLLKTHDRWREQKRRELEAARRENDKWESRREADYLAERIAERLRGSGQ
jgi:hypothetical protein